MKNKWFVAGLVLLAFTALLAWRMQLPAPAAREDHDAVPVRLAGQSEAEDVTEEISRADDAGDESGAEEPGGPVKIEDEASMQALFMSLAGRLEGPMRGWAETRGMPRTDPSGNFVLDQPYQQYDDETLQGLADNGDMWAQQILAERIARARPAEAMELYRQAAAAGSVYAMLQMSRLSARIASLSPDFSFEDEGVALEQYYSLRDAPVPPDVTSAAWLTVAEMAGLPGLMAMTGDYQGPADESDAACQLAGSIYTDLLEQRAAASLGAYPSDPPPVWVDAGLSGGGQACTHEQAVTYDFSSCKQYAVKNPDTGEDMGFYVCQDF